jgi:hypothetical protein
VSFYKALTCFGCLHMMTRTIRNSDWCTEEELVMSRVYKGSVQKLLLYLPRALQFYCEVLYCSFFRSFDVCLIDYIPWRTECTERGMLWLCTNISCFSIAAVQKCCLLYSSYTLQCYGWSFLEVFLTKAKIKTCIRYCGWIQAVHSYLYRTGCNSEPLQDKII